jgi:hypothetical protein
MLQTPPKTQAAFLALLAAIDAEIKELEAAGQERFHDHGLPRAARPLLQDAVQRARIRDELAKLHAQWFREIPLPPPPPAPPLDRPSADEKQRRAEFKNAPGMSHDEAARRLGVSSVKVLAWLEAGVLKGQQLTRTKWKISGPELVSFAREHKELL